MQFDVYRRTGYIALPFILSLIAGSTDTISFLGMNGLFTAHITGDLVILASHLVAGDTATVSFMLAVPVFVVTLLLTSVFANRFQRAADQKLRPLLSLEFLLLLVFLTLSVTFTPRFDTNSALAVITGMVGVGAMAVQAALVQISLTNSPSTAVMTTNMTHLVVALGQVLVGHDPDTIQKARARIAHVLPVIIGFAIGCAAGAATQAKWGLWSLGLPAALALLALIMAGSRPATARTATLPGT
jgi:uncharacterized membrane protein YoaK (UPF0700 family)